MEEALNLGYDSDGWVGPPPRGTDPREIAAVDKEEITDNAANAKAGGGRKKSATSTVPKHILFQRMH